MELSCFSGNGNPEKILIFSKKKAVLLFPETGTPIFQEIEFFSSKNY